MNYVLKGISAQFGKSKNPGSKRPGALYIYCTAGINPVARSFASNPPPRYTNTSVRTCSWVRLMALPRFSYPFQRLLTFRTSIWVKVL